MFCKIQVKEPRNTQLHLLARCLIYTQSVLEYVIFILWVRSFSKMLPSVKFAEDKVLVYSCSPFFMKNAKTVRRLSLTLILNPNFQSRLIINRSGIVEQQTVSKKSGTIKERTQMSTEMASAVNQLIPISVHKLGHQLIHHHHHHLICSNQQNNAIQTCTE